MFFLLFFHGQCPFNFKNRKNLFILLLTKLVKTRMPYYLLVSFCYLIACLSSFFFFNECRGQRLTAAICFNCFPLNMEFSTLQVWLSSKPFSSPSLRLQICPALSAFTWVLRTQTQALMLGQPAFYLQNPLSRFWNNFNIMFSICIYLVWVYVSFL